MKDYETAEQYTTEDFVYVYSPVWPYRRRVYRPRWWWRRRRLHPYMNYW